MRDASLSFSPKLILPVFGFACLWFSLRISFFFGLFAEGSAASAWRELYYGCYLGFLAIGLLAIAALGMRFDGLVGKGSGVLAAIGAAPSLLFGLALLCSYGGFAASALLFVLFALAGIGSAVLYVAWGGVLVRQFPHQVNAVVGVAFLVHMLVSIGFSSLQGLALGCCVAASSLLSAAALWASWRKWAMLGASRQGAELLGSDFGATQAVDATALKRTGVLTAICIYIGAIVWGFFAPPVIGEVTFPQHLITFFVAAITFAFITFLPSNQNAQQFRRFAKIALMILLFFGLFLIIALGSESYVGTSVLIAALFCLETYAWIVIASAALRSHYPTASWFALGLLVAVVAPTLIRNILGPYLYRYLGFLDHANLDHYVLLLTTFVLLVVTILFLNADNRVAGAAQRPAKNEAFEAFASRNGLTAREMEIVELVSKGNSQKKIADLLYISPSTVQTHMKSIYRRLGIHNKQELVDLLHRGE